MASLLENINNEFAQISECVQGSLVRVVNGRSGAGAGTIWHSDGLVLTNAHVVGNREVKVILPDGDEKEAEILALDRERDLAALSVQAKDLPTIELGNPKSLRPGDWVLAFGHPWGIHGGATAGSFIGHGDQLPEQPRFGRDWLAVSLHYRPGHSGGPLVDVSGKLVGINTIMTGPDVGLAIPIHEVVRFLKKNLNRT
jgi:serine protease Do